MTASDWQNTPSGRVLSPHDKSMPAWASGLSAEQFIARGPHVSDLWTPLVVLDDDALAANISFLSDWVRGAGLELMPHGKTTMAPQLWRRQVDAGATGITVATPWQARVAREAGIEHIMIANQLADRAAIAWLAAENARVTGTVWSWVDSVAGIEALARDAGAAPFDVLVELGRPGGRTGARSLDEAVALAEQIVATPGVRLAGIAGYEGAVAHGRSAEALETVSDYLDDILTLHTRILGLYDDGEVIVTVGGSAFPDVVSAKLAAATATTRGRFVIRSGASITHDEGYYQQVSPFEAQGLRAAIRGIARVVSAPEPGLVLLDGGKRDFPYDEGLPRVLYALRDGVRLDVPGATITAVNDQHAFLRGTDALEVGDIVVLGLSHPCTTFDKWRLIPVVASFAGEDPLVTGLVETLF